jgi:hypothetical protein
VAPLDLIAEVLLDRALSTARRESVPQRFEVGRESLDVVPVLLGVDRQVVLGEFSVHPRPVEGVVETVERFDALVERTPGVLVHAGLLAAGGQGLVCSR